MMDYDIFDEDVDFIEEDDDDFAEDYYDFEEDDDDFGPTEVHVMSLHRNDVYDIYKK